MLSRALKLLPEPCDSRLSVAPMMDRTDRHCRYFYRLLAPNIRLYTEMVTGNAVVHGDSERLLAYDVKEKPLALQLGGNDPGILAKAASIAEKLGYDEVNLNIGCPSDRVRSGAFGACLMEQPDVVAECVSAMSEVTSIPITVKTRIGIDDREDYEFLETFVRKVSEAGCAMFIVHARNAILGGLSPKQNLNIPPLRYPVVHRLKREFPHLRIVLNGGIRDTSSALEQLEHVDGIMIGRQAYKNPYWLSELQQLVLGSAHNRDGGQPDRKEVVAAMLEYARHEKGVGTRLHQVTRHMLGLYSGLPGARAWRVAVSQAAQANDLDALSSLSEEHPG
jgi:tRNA-dihydrouridine synthase A